jgi:hypothetical protein
MEIVIQLAVVIIVVGLVYCIYRAMTKDRSVDKSKWVGPQGPPPYVDPRWVQPTSKSQPDDNKEPDK